MAVLAPVGPPATWYVGLLNSGVRKRNFPVAELLTSGYPGIETPPLPATGYVRQAIPNSTSGFTASSAGVKSNVTAITFPAAVNAYTVSGIALFDAPAGGNIWATIQFPQPITVPAGSTPTIAAGTLTIANVPSLGSFGSFTNYGWGKLYDMLFGGVAFAVPSTWYAGLSTAALNKLSAGPTEPSGNGYARAAISNDTAHWAPNVTYGASGQAGDTANNVAISYPTPTGSWGTLVATALSDASSAGNAWVVAPPDVADHLRHRDAAVVRRRLHCSARPRPDRSAPHVPSPRRSRPGGPGPTPRAVVPNVLMTADRGLLSRRSLLALRHPLPGADRFHPRLLDRAAIRRLDLRLQHLPVHDRDADDAPSSRCRRASPVSPASTRRR